VRVTVCQLPHEPRALADAWAELCRHTLQSEAELVLLPEFAFVEPVWEAERFDPARWERAVALNEAWLRRLPELGAAHVVGSRPATIQGRPFNEGYLRTATGVIPLRRKFYLPSEPGCWEASWFDRGDPTFPTFQAGPASFGLNICTELWALETYAAYARAEIHLVLSPRATSRETTARWLAVGTVAAVRSGAFSLSSNRVGHDGEGCGGVGWIISPDGQVRARTSGDLPFVTMDIDLATPAAARVGYPGYVFAGGGDWAGAPLPRASGGRFCT
jgi:N-carbamoylputrescine amidase